MTTYKVLVDYTSKRRFDIEASDPQSASIQAMRQLKIDDPEAGPVGFAVFEGD